ncbi:MAG: respiratory nitrate reductase subunit gamma [Deltaproteobacteria bacterium]|nr:respiratory nitrate reductase subunit gamma [Deltaproteobacteria bacterium]
MFFDLLLYGSLSIFCIGLVNKVYIWFSRRIVKAPLDFGTGQRFLQALRGIFGVVFSSRVLILLKALLLDVILQRRILKEDAYRWIMHMLIFGGFMLLLLMHALENWTSVALFEEYASTVNPYFLLRNVFGLMVIAGVIMAIYRRQAAKVPRLRTTAMDHYVLAIVAVVILSGFFLEGAKILSYSDFNRMVQEYGDTDETEELQALEAYWVQKLGVFSPQMQGPFEADLLEKGQELHEMSCQSCHSASESAFIGYGLSLGMRPMANFLDDLGAVDILWTIHILACFFGLAYLPFSKMFHIIATPLSLLSNAVMDRDQSLPANIATRQMLELDAYVREDLLQEGTEGQPLLLTTYSFVRGLNKKKIPAGMYEKSLLTAKHSVVERWKASSERENGPITLGGRTPGAGADFPHDADSFYACFGCQNCTTVCPVVIGLENPQEELGLLPHQIMCSLGLGLFDQACASGMLWACTTCYQCQEHCPQMVEVTNILYDLKIMAINIQHSMPGV